MFQTVLLWCQAKVMVESTTEVVGGLEDGPPAAYAIRRMSPIIVVKGNL